MSKKKLTPLEISIKRCITDGKIYDMVDYDEYGAHPNRYLGRTDVGITVERDDKKMVLPLRSAYNGNPISPGVYNAGAVDFTIYPDKQTEDKYVPSNVIEIKNNMDIASMVKTSEEIKRIDEPFITTPDNITKVNIQDNDQPEMKALKMAINEKNIDMDKYANRFGDNYNNDKRQLKNNGVTLNIIKRFCKNMDMECVLTLKDANPNVPNPIGKEISISLTDEYNTDDDLEEES